MNFGWKCPQCGTCYSPQVSMCVTCTTAQRFNFVPTDPQAPNPSCTCGKPYHCTFPIPCPIHGAPQYVVTYTTSINTSGAAPEEAPR